MTLVEHGRDISGTVAGSKIDEAGEHFYATDAGDGISDGQSVKYRKLVARFELDVDTTVADGLIGTFSTGIKLPDNAIVMDGMIDVTSTFTSSSDSGTIAIQVEGADDIIAAVAISTGTSWDAGLKDVVPVNTAATAVKTTGEKEILIVIAVQNLLTGKLVGHLDYVVSG